MIPDGWKECTIREVAKVVRGASPRPAGSPLYFNGSYLPWITVSEVTGDSSMYIDSTKTSLTEEGAKFTRIIDPGTLILSNSGATLGVPKITRIRAGANDGIAMLLDLKEATKEFLYFFLQSQTLELREVIAPGNGQPNLNTELIGGIRLLLPPIKDQKLIAKVLGTWDKAISITESMIAAKQQRKQAMMQQLLTGKKRLPGFKKPWQACRLGDLFDERAEGGRTDLPLLSITRDQGIIPRDDVERKDTSSEDKSKYLRICPGDIGYNTMRMWQGVSALSSMEGIISPAYTVCVPHSNVSARFMAHLFKFDPMIRMFERHSQGMTSDTWSLKYPNFSEIKTTVPELKEMDAIADIFDLANRELEILVRRKAALEEQKKALMAVLLTGKKRLKA